ncbi:FecR family protein [Sphingobacterium lumbrici]|uniref:FecR family protein n=1 Tax=Sphingobacterium lumbrici TaxID=2559600 RepID=UPI001128E53E|nr:FecR domain-containing protein [Sphingobacterium lumbrici]
MSKEEQFRKILSDYSEGKLSAEEVKKLEHLILKYPVGEPWDWENDAHREAVEREIRAKLDAKWGRKRPYKTSRFVIAIAAAASLACFFTFIYLYRFKTDAVSAGYYEVAKAKEYTDDQVLLIMPDGEQMNLETSVYISDIKRKIYSDDLTSLTDKDKITVKVPNQKQFNLTLDDGTKVWLNAGATLSFPVAFDKQADRVVHLDGEGYFEVVSNREHLFKVLALGTEVKVTGTKFNVQAFEEDHWVKTSLVEGNVSFYMDDKTYPLRPGQQTVANTDKKEVVTQSFDADKLLSWKEGYFVFDNMELFEVMKTVSRWYNITVVARSPITNKKIGGTFPNNGSLSDLLADLSLLSGVEFKIEGKEVLIIN